MMPTHCRRKRNSIPQSGMDLFWRASVVKTTTTHKRIMANERATRSRKLNDKAYKNSEKAVIAMPAVKMLFSVLSPTSNPSNQPLNMLPFQSYPEKLRDDNPHCRPQGRRATFVLLFY